MAQITLNSSGVASNGSLVLQSNGTTTAVTIDSSQRAAFVAGTAAAPAITTSGDTNTGIFFPAADTIAFAEGGVEAMRLDSSGNMGLGVTPSAWSGFKALQIGAGGALANPNSLTRVDLTTNAYYNGTQDTYIGTGAATSYRQNGGQHIWYYAASGSAGGAISYTEVMRTDTSGRLGLGTTSPSAKLDISYSGGTLFKCEIANVAQLNIGNGGNSINYYDGDTQIFRSGAGTERARIASSGYFKASDNGTYDGAASSQHEFNQSANNRILAIKNTNGSLTTDANLLIQAERNTTNNTFYAFGYYNIGAAAWKFRIADSGNATNTNNSYGAISDIKLKENITDATPKLAQLNQVRVVNYNFIGSEQKQLGVIAQEVEQIFPGMVEETIDRDVEGNDLGTTTKSVKYSVFVPMLIKAIQEQQAIITQLQADVAALKG